MVRYIQLAVLLCCFSATRGQTGSGGDSSVAASPVIMVGAGAGYNNLCGVMGVRSELRVMKHLSFGIGIGVGNRDLKAGARVNVFLGSQPLHAYLFGGGTYSTGSFDTYERRLLEIEIRTTGIENPQVKKDLVDVKLLPVTTVDAGLGYAFHLGSRIKYVAEAGYSLSVTEDTYRIRFAKRHGTNINLTEKAEDKLTFFIPGGFIFGLGVFF